MSTIPPPRFLLSPVLCVYVYGTQCSGRFLYIYIYIYIYGDEFFPPRHFPSFLPARCALSWHLIFSLMGREELSLDEDLRAELGIIAEADHNEDRTSTAIAAADTAHARAEDQSNEEKEGGSG